MTDTPAGNAPPPAATPPRLWRRFAHAAMRTRFEVVIAGEDDDYAAKVAANAFDDLDRLEQQLSRFIASSDIAQLSALQAGQSLRVGEAAFECLRLAAQVWRETQGAFDVTVGALMDYWRNPGARTGEALAAARMRTGMERLELNERGYEATVKGGPVSLDLGAIGKGYAVDRMAALLQEWGVPSAVVHGGTSSVRALAPPPGLDGWPFTLANPRKPSECLKRVFLRHRSLSGSSIVDDPHILDPRTGRPATGRLGAWALAPNAALADALSTAFLVMSSDDVQAYCQRHPDCAAACATPGPAGAVLQSWNWDELGQ